MKIKKVELKYFKFHNELPIDIDSKNFLIYGENGAGKSSIYEALYSNFYHQQNSIRDTYLSRNCQSEQLEVNIAFDDGQVLNRNDDNLTSRNVLSNSNIYFANEKVLNRLTKENFYIALTDTLIVHFPKLKDLTKVFHEKFEDFRRWKDNIRHQQKRPLKDGEKPVDYYLKIEEYREDLDKELNRLNQIFEESFQKEVPKDSINKIIKENFDENFSITFDFHGAKIPTNIENTGLDFEIALPIIRIKIDEIEYGGKLSQHFNEAKLKLIGVAIYFALAKKYEIQHNKFKLLVLDDFLTSLDMANRKLIIKYILEEFKDYQKLILTHNLQFFNMVTKMIHLDSEDKKNWKIQKLFIYDNQAFLYDKNLSYIPDAQNRLEEGDLHSAGNFIRKEFERIVSEFEQLLELGKVEELQNIIDALTSKDKHYIYSHKITNNFYEKVKNILKDSQKSERDKIRFINDAFEELNKTVIDFNDKIRNSDGTTSGTTIKILIKRGEFYKNFILNPTSHNDIDIEIYQKECINGINLLKYLNKIITNLKGKRFE
ncbi:AAA family ATPase [Aliarcobacter cryaerophilus]|jgi:energy-coupling factor transporter ATP-binding protein EcfA2|uniref:AAA family ATPase n=1 Tax=Aliarcobacter cryaerophilus TaxID=28198 RepID=UPI00082B2EB0|nr:AAA family ATPase [Aliarcobacter cryaerophilus]MCT7533666.1 AAA family ATPase [Aliarcobacter cryaerophilus]